MNWWCKVIKIGFPIITDDDGNPQVFYPKIKIMERTEILKNILLYVLLDKKEKTRI